MNEMEGGGSGENDMYHVLEKPRDDNYEDPDKDLEENIAMEYEIPLPLKEIWLKHLRIYMHEWCF